MGQTYTAHVPVRSLDLDSWGDLPPATLLAYFQQSAWESSLAAGFPESWYEAENSAWVLHRITLARLSTLTFGTVAAVTTWVPVFRRVRAQREFEVQAPDGTPIAAATSEWAFVDRTRGLPKPVDPRIPPLFAGGDPTPLLETPTPAEPLTDPRAFVAGRRVYRYECDVIGHVNNTVYPTWLDEALADALAETGLPLARPGGPGLRLAGRWYRLDYLRPASSGDPLTIRSTLRGRSADGLALAWEQQIVRDSDGALILTCHSHQQICGLAAADLTAADLWQALDP